MFFTDFQEAITLPLALDFTENPIGTIGVFPDASD